MELYLLDPTFLREDVIDEFESNIWTERFIEAGEFSLVLPATPEKILALTDKKFLSLVGSGEVMLIETLSIEEGAMTVTGKSLETFFNERIIRISSDLEVNDWTIRDTPGNILGAIVDHVGVGIGDALNDIPYLVVGDLDASDPIVTRVIPNGPKYDAMLSIAQTYKLGMAVYLSRIDFFGYELTFTAFKGVDRTSTQVENDPIRFSPALDSMTDTKELSSTVGYKTVVYAFPPSAHPGSPVVEYAPGTDPGATGFDRRVLVIHCDDITDDMIADSSLAALMTQAAKDALANNNFTKIIDGEVVPQPGYIYGVHYKLGDVVELVGHSGVPQRAIVTEYIRSKDAEGERAYPTVSVL